MTAHRIRLLSLLILLAAAPLWPATNDLTAVVVKGPTGTRIDDFMSRLEKLGYSGAIIVGKDGQVVLHKAYGYSNPVAKTPYTIDTASTIGSITKQFTASAILALQEAGKVDVNDPITKYFKDVPPDKQTITLHQLLTHSAGFPGAIGDDNEPTGREEFIRRAMGRKLLFTPGSAYEYSNVGYSLLAAIVEQVTGATYERYLHDRLFARAGMEHTGYVIPKWDKLARGLFNGELAPPFEGQWAADGPYWHCRGNCGILSTPADMYRWHLALLGDKVLSAESRKKLFTPYVKEGQAPSSYGYGWAIAPLPNGHQVIMHNGGNGTYAADFRRYLDDGVVIFITSNISDKPSIAVDRFVARLALGQEVPMPPKVADLPKEKLTAFEGTYGKEGASVKVSVAPDGSVAVTPADAGGFVLLSPPAGPRQARVDEVAAKSKPIADGILARDYKPLQKAFDVERPLEDIEQRQTAMREQIEAKLGPMKSATVVGARTDRGMLASFVRFDFERGSRYVRLMWDGPNALVGLRITDDMPGTIFKPVSPTELAAYDFMSGETTTARLADGKLTIGGETLARR